MKRWLLAASYPEGLTKTISHKDAFSKLQIFSVEEATLHWKKILFKSFIAREEKSMPGFKISNDRLTLLFRATVAGDFQGEPFLIYYSENPRTF